MPAISKYMTAAPHSIGRDIPIKKALEMMREHRIRHLPVQDAGQLVGILSDRDVKLASSFHDSWAFNAEDVMTPDPYTVKAVTELSEAVAEMAERKYGCALVVDESGKLVGIFTDNDGLRVLADLLRKR